MKRKRGGSYRLVAIPAAVVIFLVTAAVVAAATAEDVVEAPTWLLRLEEFFVLLTAGVVAFGILHVELELLHWGWTIMQGGDKPAQANPSATERVRLFRERSVERFDKHQIVQHILLFSSFIVLALTGLPQKFYSWAPFDAIIQAVGGMATLRLIHRVAGVVMVLDGFYHLMYIMRGLTSEQARQANRPIARWVEIIPTPKDFVDFFAMVQFLLGLRPTPPKFGWFTYMQKFDYWAVFWGLSVMGGTGLAMMFPNVTGGIGGTALIAASLTAHSDEAILAVGWILIVHLYHAHFSPAVFPFNTTIFTGRISTKLLAERHALEYARLVGEAPLTEEEEKRSQPSPGRVVARPR